MDTLHCHSRCSKSTLAFVQTAAIMTLMDFRVFVSSVPLFSLYVLFIRAEDSFLKNLLLFFFFIFDSRKKIREGRWFNKFRSKFRIKESVFFSSVKFIRMSLRLIYDDFLKVFFLFFGWFLIRCHSRKVSSNIRSNKNWSKNFERIRISVFIDFRV